MTTDDLSTPLGQGKTRNRRELLRISLAARVAHLLALPVRLAGWTMFGDDPVRRRTDGGRARHWSSDAEPRANAPISPGSAARRRAGLQTAAPRARRYQDRHHHRWHERRAARYPDSGDPRLRGATATRPPSSVSANRRVTARCRRSPRTERGRRRHSRAPAQADTARRNAPRVALVVGGLGIGATGTTTRCASFRPVTLAFAPYGGDLERQVARARRRATRCCCNCRWSRSTIPTTIPARTRC